jgi:putative ABC transport system permease protein
MAMAARERIVEFAVLRTLGFTRKTLFGLLVGESALLSLTGACVGLALFLGLFPKLKAFVLYSPLAGLAAALRVYPEVLAGAFALTVLVGILAGLGPALRSSRRSIVDGLRQVA